MRPGAPGREPTVSPRRSRASVQQHVQTWRGGAAHPDPPGCRADRPPSAVGHSAAGRARFRDREGAEGRLGALAVAPHPCAGPHARARVGLPRMNTAPPQRNDKDSWGPHYGQQPPGTEARSMAAKVPETLLSVPPPQKARLPLPAHKSKGKNQQKWSESTYSNCGNESKVMLTLKIKQPVVFSQKK